MLSHWIRWSCLPRAGRATDRLPGGWAQRASGEMALRLLEDVGADARAGIDAAAARMAAWIGEVRFTPRFRTPLERELSA